MRPTNPEDQDWTDNKLSNFLAGASQTIVPKWCSNQEHWTSTITAYLWTDCACCLLFRGVTIGAVIGTSFGFAIGLLF